MMKSNYLVYALDKVIDGKSPGERISEVRRQLMKFDCNPLEDEDWEYIESKTTQESRTVIINILNRYDSLPMHDPIIAVPTWKDIAHPEVARRLSEGNYSVLIAEYAKDFDRQKTEGEYVGVGPVLNHISENSAKLRAYLDSLGHLKTQGENQRNRGRKNSAKDFAEIMWAHIERIACEANTTVLYEAVKKYFPSKS